MVANLPTSTTHMLPPGNNTATTHYCYRMTYSCIVPERQCVCVLNVKITAGKLWLLVGGSSNGDFKLQWKNNTRCNSMTLQRRSTECRWCCRIPEKTVARLAPITSLRSTGHALLVKCLYHAPRSLLHCSASWSWRLHRLSQKGTTNFTPFQSTTTYHNQRTNQQKCSFCDISCKDIQNNNNQLT
jgi:hypothetical protein